MKRVMVAVVAAVTMVGCGADLCAKSQECATKSGEAFSLTQCQNDAKVAREQAQSKGCGSQYDDFASCAAGLACGSTLDQLNANCGGKGNALSKCLQ